MLQRVTQDYRGLKGGYKRLHAGAYRELPGVTRGYRWLQEVIGGYKWL